MRLLPLYSLIRVSYLFFTSLEEETMRPFIRDAPVRKERVFLHPRSSVNLPFEDARIWGASRRTLADFFDPPSVTIAHVLAERRTRDRSREGIKSLLCSRNWTAAPSISGRRNYVATPLIDRYRLDACPDYPLRHFLKMITFRYYF